MEDEYPEFFARFYDLVYHKVRSGTDHDFFMNKIMAADGKVLEIGAGTGRFFNEALKRGADIYGIDTSKAMLDILKSKLNQADHHRVGVQNFIDFNYDFKFNLIVAPFRVMMHLINKEDQIKALNNVYKHLNLGGNFIFDVFIPDLNQLIKGVDKQVDFDEEYDDGKRFKRTVSTRPDLIEQLIHVTFDFEWDENKGKRSERWELPLRYFFRFELEHLMERSAFEKYKILGDYHGGGLNNDSKEFIVFCQKSHTK